MLSSNYLLQNRANHGSPISLLTTLIAAASLPPSTRHVTIVQTTSSTATIGNRHAPRALLLANAIGLVYALISNQQLQVIIATLHKTLSEPPPNNNATTTTINARHEIITIPPCVGHRVQIIGITLKIYCPPSIYIIYPSIAIALHPLML